MDTDAPDRPPLDPAALGELLRGTAWRVEVVPEAASTNLLVAARAREGVEEGLVVVTEHQTAGRGRLDRTWVTPARSALTFSALLRPRAPERSWTWVPLLTGLAVVEGVVAAGGPRCGLKWPNDVVHADLKLAGLLAEVVAAPSGPAVVTGVGLNVGMRADELPVPTATSLALTGHPVPGRTALLAAVLRSLGSRYERWQRDPAALRREYAAACSTLGRRVRAELPSGEQVTGTARDVDPNGSLVVEPPGGGRTVVSAGDVVHLRPFG